MAFSTDHSSRGLPSWLQKTFARVLVLLSVNTCFILLHSYNLPGIETRWTYDDRPLWEEGKPEPCPDFGCPQYPAELDPYWHRMLEEVFVNKTRDASDFSFGAEYFALLTQKGMSHYVNQDRAVVIAPYTALPSSPQMEKTVLVGLFDGHGQQGHIVADHVTRELPERLAKELRAIPKDKVTDQAIVGALNKTFVEVDIYAPPNFLLGGTTASVALRWGSKLFIANVGDSQTVVVSLPPNEMHEDPPNKGRSVEDFNVVYETRKDKAILPDEYARITGLGGKIHINPHNNESRVVVMSVAARDQIGLAMSRSLGDWEWKAIGVTSEPLIDVIDLNKYPNAYLIAASDGAWERRWRPFFAKQFSESFYVGKKPPLQKCWDILRVLTPEVKRGYCDDMTVVVMKL